MSPENLNFPILELQRLEAEWAKRHLDQAPFPLSFEIHEQLASTSDRLQALMHEGAPAGTVVIAQAQTQGRGQQGRTWVSSPGGLYLSIGLRPDLPAIESARLTLGCAWGIATVFRHEGIPLDLKWPNDLLLNGKKLGGILTESRLRGTTIHQVVVGIGLNWANNVVPANGISLQPFLEKHSSVRITSLEGVIALVLEGVLLGCRQWQNLAIPLKKLLKDYEKLVKIVGQPVQVGSEWGTMTGIATTGELLVDLRGQLLKFPPGTIQLGYD